MSAAHFHFLAELNDFLPLDRRNTILLQEFKGRQSIKHLVEALGVPHTEVGQILVNGQPATLGSITQEGDEIEVFPAAPPFEGAELRFLLDNHLGRLAAYLRALGFDTQYRNDFQDDELVQIAVQDRRILLTRDRRLLMRKAVIYGYCPHSLDPHEQIFEVVRRFDLANKIIPFQRCLRCNHPLEPVSKAAIIDRLEPLTQLYFDEFHLCPACHQVYWKGSHFEHLQALIARLEKTG